MRIERLRTERAHLLYEEVTPARIRVVHEELSVRVINPHSATRAGSGQAYGIGSHSLCGSLGEPTLLIATIRIIIILVCGRPVPPRKDVALGGCPCRP